MCVLCLVPDSNKSTVKKSPGNLDTDIFDAKELFSNFIRFNNCVFLKYLCFNILELPTKIFMDVMGYLRSLPQIICGGGIQGVEE